MARQYKYQYVYIVCMKGKVFIKGTLWYTWASICVIVTTHITAEDVQQMEETLSFNTAFLQLLQ